MELETFARRLSLEKANRPRGRINRIAYPAGSKVTDRIESLLSKVLDLLDSTEKRAAIDDELVLALDDFVQDRSTREMYGEEGRYLKYIKTTSRSKALQMQVCLSASNIFTSQEALPLHSY